jgi:hypothetical protein
MSNAIMKAVNRRWAKLHNHQCPECGGNTECRDAECEVTEDRVGHAFDGEERVCKACSRIPFLDLRPITRQPDRFLTTVKLYHDHFRGKEWIIMGQARLVRQERGWSSGPGRWAFDAYLPEDVTDFEHDSAFAIRMSLVGVEFKSTYNGYTEVVAIIDPVDFDGFNVPPVGYNPMKSGHQRDRCKESHIIVPEDGYVPKHNADLFKLARGRFVEITFGVPPKEGD